MRKVLHIGFHVLIFSCIKFLDHGLLLFFGLARSIFWDMLDVRWLQEGPFNPLSCVMTICRKHHRKVNGWFLFRGTVPYPSISDLPSQNTSESMILHIPKVGRYDIPNSFLCFSLDQPGSGCLWSVQCSCRPHWHQEVHDLVPGSHWELLYFHYHSPYF